MKTQLNYRTFDDLLTEVSADFKQYDMEGMIDPSELIKVAQRVNYELGLRIHQPKDEILEIDCGKAKLPDDFYVLNYANLCGKYKVEEPVIHGSHIEERLLEPNAENWDACGKVFCTPCGQYVNLVQKFKYETRVYDVFHPLNVSAGKLVADDCPNKKVDSPYSAKLRDGYLFTNLETGKVHINYLGNLEDEDGNLLVLDHPLINEFYEYALKSRILENLYINGEDVERKMLLIDQRLRAARNNAYSIANMPDFSEMKKLWEVNRKAMYGKYYHNFI